MLKDCLQRINFQKPFLSLWYDVSVAQSQVSQPCEATIHLEAKSLSSSGECSWWTVGFIWGWGKGEGGPNVFLPQHPLWTKVCLPGGRSLESWVLSWRVQGQGLGGSCVCPLELKDKGVNINGYTAGFDSCVYPFCLY